MRSESVPTYRLMYVSHVAPAAKLTLEFVMRQILFTSVWCNRRDGITGLLVSDGDWFAQVLEGRQDLVEDCYARIAADPRHWTPTVRMRGPVEARLFERWSMCGVTLTGFEDALWRSRDIVLDVWSLEPDALLQFLRGISERYAPELDALHAELGAGLSGEELGKEPGRGR